MGSLANPVVIVPENAISVTASFTPVHDALLIEAPIAAIDSTVIDTTAIMGEASQIVLGGFTLRTEAKVVRWPERYMDDRGKRFWNEVMDLLPNLPNMDHFNMDHFGSMTRATDGPTLGPPAAHLSSLLSLSSRGL